MPAPTTLTDVATWRLVFLINPPITAFAMLVTLRAVPGTSSLARPR